MTRAAIYCRISRDRTGAGLGVERQEADARALAERLGLEVAALYVDNDISASGRKPRPEYLRMLDDIRAGRIAAVIAWHTDRLHRSPVELETYISTCETHAVLTHTVQAGPIDLATPSGQLVARQLGAVARYEVDNGAKRQQRKKLETAAAGQFSGGRRPFGYEPDGVTVRESEAKVIAEVTDAILVGSSLRAQVARLNAAGATTSTGKSWTATELRRVLIRPRNAGLRQHRGTRGSVPSYTCVAGKCVGRNAAELERLVVGVIIQRLKRADAIDLLRPAAPEIDVAGLRSEEAALRQRLDDLADDLDLDERTLARRTRALNDRLATIVDQLAEAGRGNVLAGVVDAPDVDAAWERLDLDRKRAIIAFFADVVVHRTGKGRPKGWKPGQSYFDPTTVDVIGKV
jgi:DNA invertase Pin-like site-specific DNA recombinase